MRPLRGPLLYSVPGVSGVSLPALSIGAPITFYWPRPLFVTSILMIARSGLPSDVAALRIQILDETQQEMIFDGRGGVSGSAGFFSTICVDGSVFADLVSVRSHKLQRPIAAGDNWIFTITNTHADRAIVPELTMQFDEGDLP